MKKQLIAALFLLASSRGFAGVPVNQTPYAEIITMARETDSDSLVIMKNGQIVVEEFFGKTPKRDTIQSVTKSISSLLIGILISERKITSVDSLVSKWYPNWASDPEKSKITLRMILSHSSGLTDDDAMWNQDNIAEYMAAKPLTYSPGTNFSYSTGAIQLLAPIIAQASGVPADQLVAQKIFSKLGISDWTWAKDKSGNLETGGGLYMTPKDLLKIGIMMSQSGQWNGEQIIPQAWINLSVTSSQSFFPGYGLLWWLYGDFVSGVFKADVYSAVGYGGQYITVFPSEKIVAIRTRGLDDDTSTAHLQKIAFSEFPSMIENLRSSQAPSKILARPIPWKIVSESHRATR